MDVKTCMLETLKHSSHLFVVIFMKLPTSTDKAFVAGTRT